MAWDLEVELANRPGTIADLGEAAAAAGVNILGVCGFPCEGMGVMHVLVEEAAPAGDAFRSAGLEVRGSREVLVASLSNTPGSLGELTRRFATAGVNVDLLYVAADNQVVMGVDDLESGSRLLTG